jgi:hypothetical protein
MLFFANIQFVNSRTYSAQRTACGSASSSGEDVAVRTLWNATYAHSVNMDSSAVAIVMNSTMEQKILTEITL